MSGSFEKSVKGATKIKVGAFRAGHGGMIEVRTE